MMTSESTIGLTTPEPQREMNTERTMSTYSKLISDLTAAVAAASKAGLDDESIVSALNTLAELVSNAEE